MGRLIDIHRNERKDNFRAMHEAIERTELGLRSVSIMYDEHSNDVKSKENIFSQKENIYYKLSSIRFQYQLLLEQLSRSEAYLSRIDRDTKHGLRGFIIRNPHLDKVEVEVSSIFDNIVFNAVSIFDYLSHDVCYICKANKQKTEYWSKLFKYASNKSTEIGQLSIAATIIKANQNLVGKLTDYRSRLIHRERDRHVVSLLMHINSPVDYELRVIASSELTSKRYLSSLRNSHPNESNFSLLYVAHWLIRKTLETVEDILDGLVVEIKLDSHFSANLNAQHKGKGIFMGRIDPVTNQLINISDVLWKQYKDAAEIHSAK